MLIARSDRKTHDNPASTGENIGPGAYDIVDRKKKTFAAFLPTGERLDVGFDLAPNFTPGPGHYRAKTPKHSSIKIGTAARFTTSANAMPGPGAYEVPAGGALAARPKTVHMVAIPDKAADKQVRVGDVLWSRGAASVPSIPERFSAGYIETDGVPKLTKTLEPNTKSDIGPGAYDPTAPTRRARTGCKFGTSDTLRMQYSLTPSGVGPGTYSPQLVRGSSAPNRKKKFSTPFASTQLRDTIIKNDVPGPGDYDVKQSAFRKNPSPPVQSQFFGSSATRFAAAASADVPGPGTYDNIIPASALPPHHGDLYGARHPVLAPFGGTAERFSGRPLLEELGPGSYDTGTSIRQKPSTFSQASRFKEPKPLPEKPATAPQPRASGRGSGSQYMGTAGRLSKRVPYASRVKVPSSVFASASPRLLFNIDDAPSPTNYDVTSIHLNATVSHGPRNKMFGIDQRFKANSLFGGPARTGIPGPGNYHTEDRAPAPSGNKHFLSTDARFKPPKTEALRGPGYYETQQRGGFIKPSFNALAKHQLAHGHAMLDAAHSAATNAAPPNDGHLQLQL